MFIILNFTTIFTSGIPAGSLPKYFVVWQHQNGKTAIVERDKKRVSFKDKLCYKITAFQIKFKNSF